MIAHKSNLQFDDFFIIKSSLDFIQPENDQEVNVPEITSQYVVDLNYGFRQENESIFLFIKAAVNRVRQPKLGYIIFCEAVGVLDASRIKTLPEPDSRSWKTNAVNYGISYLRAHVEAMTTFGAFGKYSLPLIDLMGLIRSKQELLARKVAAGQKTEVKETNKPKRKKTP